MTFRTIIEPFKIHSVAPLRMTTQPEREEHINNYNHYRPHSALAYLTPIEYATKWRTENSVLTS